MQILNANVRRDQAQGCLVIEFMGEGNEQILVQLREDLNLNDKEAIARAKAVMVQASAFGSGSAFDEDVYDYKAS